MPERNPAAFAGVGSGPIHELACVSELVEIRIVRWLAGEKSKSNGKSVIRIGFWAQFYCAVRNPSSRPISLIRQGFPAHFPLPRRNPRCRLWHRPAEGSPGMKLEFHQLDRRHEQLRVRNAQRQRQLLASLATAGQQTPIIVVAVSDQPDRYLVIDGYKRVAALEQLGRDMVEAVIWPLNEVQALVLDRSLHWSERESALEEGWLLAELEHT